MSPLPFKAVVAQSLSRFFRDALEFGIFERQLNKHGVKLISITQQTSEDPAGEMASKIFSLFVGRRFLTLKGVMLKFVLLNFIWRE